MNEKITADTEKLKTSLSSKCQSERNALKQDLTNQCSTVTEQMSTTLSSMAEKQQQAQEKSLNKQCSEQKIEIQTSLSLQCKIDIQQVRKEMNTWHLNEIENHTDNLNDLSEDAATRLKLDLAKQCQS